MDRGGQVGKLLSRIRDMSLKIHTRATMILAQSPDTELAHREALEINTEATKIVQMVNNAMEGGE